MSRAYERDLPSRIAAGVRKATVNGLELELRPVPDDDREHCLDPRVVELFALRKSGAFPTPVGNDLVSMRNRPNKENRQIDSGAVSERVELMDFGSRKIHLFVFEPEGHSEKLPVLAYLHGGGFTVGNIGMFRNALRYLAEKANCVVVYPEYRLAPESPFPAQVEDCKDTITWVVEHAGELSVDVARLAVAGDSAGGSLSNAMAILHEGTVRLVVEMYPLVDGGPIPEEWSLDMYPHLAEQGEAALSRTLRIRNASSDLESVLVSNPNLMYDPLISATYYAKLSAFPRTVMVTSEFDYLRYQDEAFAKKLRDAGASVRVIRYLGCDHGFFEMCGVMPQVEDLCNVMAEEIAAL